MRKCCQRQWDSFTKHFINYSVGFVTPFVFVRIPRCMR
uniref:Uncharacterized protein n=1 Tax=Anguilla anguilla TaxID=7936 RepID=A0A0E9T6K3_ANGAN